MPVVGFVSLGPLDTYTRNFVAFRAGLGEIGYVEGQNVSVEQHWLEGHYERTPALVAEAARQRCGSGTVPACFRGTIGGLFGRPKREKPCGFCRVFGPLTAGIEARLFLGPPIEGRDNVQAARFLALPHHADLAVHPITSNHGKRPAARSVSICSSNCSIFFRSPDAVWPRE
jgi:hypothetical protein